MAGIVVRGIFHCFLQSDNRIIRLLLLDLNFSTEHQRIGIAAVLQDGIIERYGLVEFVRRDKKLDVGFLDRKIVGVTGDQGRKLREGLLGIVSCDVEVNEHALTGGDVGHLRFAVNQNFLSLIDLALREIQSCQRGTGRGIFGRRLDRSLKLFASVVQALLGFVESAEIHAWLNRIGIAGLCLLITGLGLAVGAPLLL